MGIRGLAQVVGADAIVLRGGRGRPRRPAGRARPRRPPALRPFLVEGLVGAGRTVLAVVATAREAEDLVDSLEGLLPHDSVAYYPAWETLPHERLSPRSDTVGPSAGRAAATRPPRSVRPDRPGEGRGGAGAQRAAAAGARAGGSGAGAARGRRHRRPRRPGRAAGRRRLSPGRPGREARRVRRARRHRRRVPTDRGASAAGGVLRRRDRGDPVLRRRRPALARDRRAAVGAAVPGAPPHP